MRIYVDVSVSVRGRRSYEADGSLGKRLGSRRDYMCISASA